MIVSKAILSISILEDANSNGNSGENKIGAKNESEYSDDSERLASSNAPLTNPTNREW